MIYFIDSTAFSDLSETRCSETQNPDFCANQQEKRTKKAICANYNEFYEKSQKNMSITNTKLEKLNNYFKNKYPDFPGITITDELMEM